ncbi:MAG: conserved exported protein of unknown function [Nitrospira sp.]|nr:MAG: conserved exported protein of unknown function [Nitrospira sp.]
MHRLICCTCWLTALLLSGCINLSFRLTPEDLSVKPMVEGKDCAYAAFGFGYGTTTVEQAMANATPPIQNIRSVGINEFYLLGVYRGCLIVVGEGAPSARK